MSCLLYGIVRAPAGASAGGAPPPPLAPGVAGAPVRLIEHRGLGAAVSAIDPPDPTSGVEPLLTYAKVIEALHVDRTVLPMRYGCLFREEAEVVELLRARGDHYAAVLRELEGCVEMGVRVLLAPPSSPCRPATCCGSGRAYLAERAARYAREEEAARAGAAVVACLRGALGGLARRTRTEPGGGADRPVASLDFLVERGAVESFRRAFRRIQGPASARLLLTGPWPPYSFVTSERDGDRHG